QTSTFCSRTRSASSRKGPAKPGTSTAKLSPPSDRATSGSLTSHPLEAHGGSDGAERLHRHRPDTLDAGGQDLLHESRGVLELGPSLAEPLEPFDQVIRQQ